MITPAKATIQGKGTQKVKIEFRPQRAMDIFREKILVDVPNQVTPHHFYLYGNAFKYQMYCLYKQPIDQFDDNNLPHAYVFFVYYKRFCHLKSFQFKSQKVRKMIVFTSKCRFEDLQRMGVREDAKEEKIFSLDFPFDQTPGEDQKRHLVVGYVLF